MEQLAKKAEKYRNHGGIHSAAVGSPDGTLLLHAEDIGRHNTFDRLAGEALLKGVELAGTLLVTSGRVSAEMAAKAAALSISLIASRTSPTDMAIRICHESAITLVGYLLNIPIPPTAAKSRAVARSVPAINASFPKRIHQPKPISAIDKAG